MLSSVWCSTNELFMNTDIVVVVIQTTKIGIFHSGDILRVQIGRNQCTSCFNFLMYYQSRSDIKQQRFLLLFIGTNRAQNPLCKPCIRAAVQNILY